MVRWYVTMFIGAITLTAGYYIGRGRAAALLRESYKILESVEMIVKEAEKLNEETEDMLNEQ